jgi:hypothetical protein
MNNLMLFIYSFSLFFSLLGEINRKQIPDYVKSTFGFKRERLYYDFVDEFIGHNNLEIHDI